MTTEERDLLKLILAGWRDDIAYMERVLREDAKARGQEVTVVRPTVGQSKRAH